MKSFSQFIIEKKYYSNDNSGGYSSSPKSKEAIKRLEKLFKLDLDSAEEKGRKRAETKKNTLSNKDGIPSSGPTPNTQSGNKNRTSKKFNDIWDDQDTKTSEPVKNPKNKKFNDFKKKAYSITDKEAKKITNKNKFSNVTTNVTNPNYLEKDPSKTKEYKTPRKYKLPKFITKTKAYQTVQKSLQSKGAQKISRITSKAAPWVNKAALPINVALGYNAARNQGRSRVGSAVKALTTASAYTAGATGGAFLAAPVPVPGARIAGGIVGGSTLSSLTSTAFDKAFPVNKKKVTTTTTNKGKNNNTVIPSSSDKKKKYRTVKGGISI